MESICRATAGFGAGGQTPPVFPAEGGSCARTRGPAMKWIGRSSRALSGSSEGSRHCCNTIAVPPNRFTEPVSRPYVRGVTTQATEYAEPDAPPGCLFFERVLSPHRSLPPYGFHVLMLVLGLISLAVGIGFVAIGAWPVIGFFGL